MAKTYDAIGPEVREWMAEQHMFFVATAPRSDAGMINLSPKGHDTLRILDDHTLAFLDYGGSGIETIAHLRENGRIVVMMCAFAGPPKIFRFHGSGDVITPKDPEFETLSEAFDRSELGIRAIIRVNVTRISDSCGFGVPLYEYQEQRRTSPNFIRSHGTERIRAYQEENNLESLDGLPGITVGEAHSYAPPTDKN